MSTETMTSAVMLIASTLLLLLTLLPTAYSQLPTSVPLPVEQFAFARAGPKAYMVGGEFVQNGTTKAVYGQVFSLDLTVAWKTASPPWQALAQVSPVYFINAVAAPDNQSIIVVQRGTNESLIFPTYRIANNAWDANPVTLNPIQESRQGIRPVMDPATGNIYMNAWTYLDVYNTISSNFQFLNMPAYTFTSRFFAGSCYNAARRSIMYFGGLNGTIQFDPAATYVSEYSISTSLWSNFTASGIPPEPRSDFCMAASEDGNRVVVFGGRIAPNTTVNPPANFTGSLYILDTVARQWTKGPDSTLRSYMGCLIVGDQLLVWGGSDGLNTYTTPPIIFDFVTNQWVDTYTPPSYLLNWAKTTTTLAGGAQPTTSSAPLGPVTDTPVAKSNNLGAILGGTFGALSVIAISAMVYLFLKRREDKIKYGAPSDQQSSVDENGEMSVSPAYLHSNNSTNSSQRNPHRPQDGDGRSPQDASGIGYSGDTASHLGQVPKGGGGIYPVEASSHAFGNVAMTSPPTMLVPNSSFIPVSGNPAFVQPNQAIYAAVPDNGMYQIYNNQPLIQGRGIQTVAPPGATFVTSEGQPMVVSYGTPVYTLPMDPTNLNGQYPTPVGFAPPFAQPGFSNHSPSSLNGSYTQAYPITPPPHFTTNHINVAPLPVSTTHFNNMAPPPASPPTSTQPHFATFNNTTTAPINPVTISGSNQTAPLQPITTT
ncbi:Leucine-zipper-like transcriptional regulator 1 [Mortierella hygrophila]|uniref:Leucine-zipper-like transcriptional regulator 1 n=1 Tax=Mortierella hygrophila TaxID=979708 RepID=A0A9P6F7J8_9FUNG|nr:Leucine-zipper-like transcriptional regulator 1 [Mortierella hygrophila]